MSPKSHLWKAFMAFSVLRKMASPHCFFPTCPPCCAPRWVVIDLLSALSPHLSITSIIHYLRELPSSLDTLLSDGDIMVMNTDMVPKLLKRESSGEERELNELTYPHLWSWFLGALSVSPLHSHNLSGQEREQLSPLYFHTSCYLLSGPSFFFLYLFYAQAL